MGFCLPQEASGKQLPWEPTGILRGDLEWLELAVSSFIQSSGNRSGEVVESSAMSAS